MRRKITLHGPSSLTISLPCTWVKDNDLKKGDEIDIEEEGNKLLIKPISNSCTFKKKEVDFAGLDLDTRKELILSLHARGYDEIKINYDKEIIGKETYFFLNEMNIGFEIINQNINSLVIRNISNPENEQFDNLLRRIFLIAKEYSKKVEERLENKDNQTFSCLVHELSIKRIANFCKRIVLKDKNNNSLFVFKIIESLEKITYSISQLLDQFQETDNCAKKELILIYNETCHIFELSYQLFYKFSLNEYNIFRNKSKETSYKIRDYKLNNLEDICCIEYIENISVETINILRQTLTIHT